MGLIKAAHDLEKKRSVKRYGLLISITFLIISLSIVNAMIVEKRPPSDAVVETFCTMLYTDCSHTENISTKLSHVFLGLTTMAVLVLLISEGVDYAMGLDLKGRRIEKKIGRLEQHVIVCGYGALGKTVCESMEKHSENYVIVDMDPKVVARLKDQGVPVVEGDALDSKILEKAGIKRAKRLVSALPTDSSNVFLTLTAKEINPFVMVATRAYSEEAIKKLHRAGADVIVMPEIVGGKELAREILDLDGSHGKELISRTGSKPESKG